MFRTIRLWWTMLRIVRVANRATDDPEFNARFARGELPWKPGDSIRELRSLRDGLELTCLSLEPREPRFEAALGHLSAALEALNEVYAEDFGVMA